MGGCSVGNVNRWTDWFGFVFGFAVVALYLWMVW